MPHAHKANICAWLTQLTAKCPSQTLHLSCALVLKNTMQYVDNKEQYG